MIRVKKWRDWKISSKLINSGSFLARDLRKVQIKKIHCQNILSNILIWVVDTLSQVFITGCYCQINVLKNKVVRGKKSPFFVIGPSCTPHSICLHIGFWQDRFVWDHSFSTYAKFSWKLTFLNPRHAHVFQKTRFRVLEAFKISSDYRIKICQSLRRKAILKIPTSVFWRNINLICWVWNKTSTKMFLNVKKSHIFP